MKEMFIRVCLSGYIENTKNDAEELRDKATELLKEREEIMKDYDFCSFPVYSEEEMEDKLEEIDCLKRRIHGCINDLNNFILRVYQFRDNPELLKEFLDGSEAFFGLKTTPLKEETENTVVIFRAG